MTLVEGMGQGHPNVLLGLRDDPHACRGLVENGGLEPPDDKKDHEEHRGSPTADFGKENDSDGPRS